MTGPSDQEPDQGPGPEVVGEQVGSVGEEAAKLLGVLQDWASGHVGGPDEARPEDVPGPGRFPTDAPECHWCPVCRTVHAVRTASPEVKAQLATAGQALLQAAAGLLTAATQAQPGADARRSGTVQRIDLDAEPQPEPTSDEHDPHQEDHQ
ncbi:hypothetical protein [Nocardioides flavescens]|uniref:Uncharacterized protein n=1 Tax=Nocardioides flavescens TaxID=2691959 RepID=A0A6L7EYS0_9ACTN|nr:hypothetical protein [Nocardioides flavescens]MXG90788.1 hypothetical protein [Nocardioides flavescens]